MLKIQMKVDSVLVAVILEILWKYKYKYIWFVSLLCCHWNTVYLNNLSTSPKSLLGAHPTFYQPLHIWTILPQHTKQPRYAPDWPLLIAGGHFHFLVTHLITGTRITSTQEQRWCSLLLLSMRSLFHVSFCLLGPLVAYQNVSIKVCDWPI